MSEEDFVRKSFTHWLTGLYAGLNQIFEIRGCSQIFLLIPMAIKANLTLELVEL